MIALGNLSTNGIIKATNVLVNGNQVLHSGNWSECCAAAEHEHEEVMFRKELASTDSSSTNTYLLFTYTTTSPYYYHYEAFDVDVIDWTVGKTTSFSCLVRGHINQSMDQSSVIKKSSSLDIDESKNIQINVVKGTSTWTYYVYLTINTAWRQPFCWFKVTSCAKITRVWSGEKVASTLGECVARSQNLYGSTLPTEYLKAGMMFFKTT